MLKYTSVLFSHNIRMQKFFTLVYLFLHNHTFPDLTENQIKINLEIRTKKHNWRRTVEAGKSKGIHITHKRIKGKCVFIYISNIIWFKSYTFFLELFTLPAKWVYTSCHLLLRKTRYRCWSSIVVIIFLFTIIKV